MEKEEMEILKDKRRRLAEAENELRRLQKSGAKSSAIMEQENKIKKIGLEGRIMPESGTLQDKAARLNIVDRKIMELKVDIRKLEDEQEIAELKAEIKKLEEEQERIRKEIP